MTSFIFVYYLSISRCLFNAHEVHDFRRVHELCYGWCARLIFYLRSFGIWHHHLENRKSKAKVMGYKNV